MPNPPLNPVVVERLVQDCSALGSTSIDAVLAGHVAVCDSPHGDAVGPLLVAASQVEGFRPLADPDRLLRIALVADEGLLALEEARHAIQDDTWLELSHVEIALPPGFVPADATRALLAELAFTVPTYVELPRTGFETALDVLAEDGAERAAYRCSGADIGGVPTDGELAAFVHGCVDRRVGFRVVAGADRAVRSDGAHPRHGVLNLLAAVAAALDGASTSELAELLAVGHAETLLDLLADCRPARVREVLHGVGSTDPTSTLGDLRAAGALT